MRVYISGGGAGNTWTQIATSSLQIAFADTTGTLAIARGGTGATDAAGARTNLDTTVSGSNLFTLPDPSAVAFIRLNADNTASALSASAFRTALGLGTIATQNANNVAITGGTIENVAATTTTLAATGTTTLATTTATAKDYEGRDLNVRVFLNGEPVDTVEIDRGTMPITRSDIRQTSFERKMRGYLTAHAAGQHKRQFGWRTFRVLAVTTDARRLGSMIEAAQRLRIPQSPGASLFFFATRNDLRSSDPLAHTWRDGLGRDARIN